MENKIKIEYSTDEDKKRIEHHKKRRIRKEMYLSGAKIEKLRITMSFRYIERNLLYIKSYNINTDKLKKEIKDHLTQLLLYFFYIESIEGESSNKYNLDDFIMCITKIAYGIDNECKSIDNIEQIVKNTYNLDIIKELYIFVS